jgi:hypothetical protein
VAEDLKPIYTAATEAAALERLAEFAGKWEAKYPVIVKLWESAWAEFVRSWPTTRSSGTPHGRPNPEDRHLGARSVPNSQQWHNWARSIGPARTLGPDIGCLDRSCRLRDELGEL